MELDYTYGSEFEVNKIKENNGKMKITKENLERRPEYIADKFEYRGDNTVSGEWASPVWSEVEEILTDGEDFGSKHARMRETLQEEALRLFVMSLGTQDGAPIPEYDASGSHVGYKRDKQGNIAISRCNTKLARELAHACDGVFVQAHEDDTDIQRIQQWVQHFEKVADEEMSQTSYVDRYHYYAITALAALCLEWLI